MDELIERFKKENPNKKIKFYIYNDKVVASWIGNYGCRYTKTIREKRDE